MDTRSFPARSSQRRPGRHTHTLFTALVLLAAAGVQPQPVRGDDCVDEAWSDYNDCLVTKRWWLRQLCDYGFVLDVYRCTEISLL